GMLPRLNASAQTPVASPAAGSATTLPVVEATDQFNVLFIRHAESEENVAPVPGVADDGVSYPLTRLGMEQANALAATLGAIPVSAILTSTRLRCIQTAQAVGLSHVVPLTLAPGIVETNFGDVASRSMGEVATTMGAWALGNPDAHTDGGESLTDQLRRFLPEVQAAIATFSDRPETLVFVAHAAVLMACLPHLFANVSPVFALTNPLQYTGIVSGTIGDGALVCTAWQGIAPA
ncbi:MAG: histidine phosphatase family protein, partial [Thermomicrobiales bacterium]